MGYRVRISASQRYVARKKPCCVLTYTNIEALVLFKRTCIAHAGAMQGCHPTYPQKRRMPLMPLASSSTSWVTNSIQTMVKMKMDDHWFKDDQELATDVSNRSFLLSLSARRRGQRVFFPIVLAPGRAAIPAILRVGKYKVGCEEGEEMIRTCTFRERIMCGLGRFFGVFCVFQHRRTQQNIHPPFTDGVVALSLLLRKSKKMIAIDDISLKPGSRHSTPRY